MVKKAEPELQRPLKPVKDFTDDELVALIENSFDCFQGSADSWESAVGMMFLGKYMGWKIVHLVHSQATVKKYEKILGINVKTDFDPITDASRRSNAWKAIEGFSNFWKAVKGETDIPDARSPVIGSAE
ncbi:hypothetical protein [Nevskia sp.]|uniref:hypothetical protein n=1 Tax=Nevskia sp. TaxID=1929292 RepID=UPI0025EC3C7A|nr:hypothetical protein [Nevskia sp.]